MAKAILEQELIEAKSIFFRYAAELIPLGCPTSSEFEAALKATYFANRAAHCCSHTNWRQVDEGKLNPDIEELLYETSPQYAGEEFNPESLKKLLLMIDGFAHNCVARDRDIDEYLDFLPPQAANLFRRAHYAIVAHLLQIKLEK